MTGAAGPYKHIKNIFGFLWFQHQQQPKSTSRGWGGGQEIILRWNRWGGVRTTSSPAQVPFIFFFSRGTVDIAYRTVAIPYYNTKWWWTTASLFHCRVSKEGPILYKVCAPIHNTFDTLYILHNVVLNTNLQFKKKWKIKTYLVWPRVDDCSSNQTNQST